MNRRMVFAALLFAAGAGPATQPATQPAGPDVAHCQVTCVQCVAPLPSDSRPNWIHDGGTAVDIYVRLRSGSIINNEGHGTRVDEFSDDRGTNLLHATPGQSSDSGISDDAGHPPEVTKDGSGIFFTVGSAALPAADATSLHMRGGMALQVADGKKQEIVADVPVKDGAAFTLGTVHYTLKDVGKNDMANLVKGFAVTFATHDDIKTVAELSFRDANDKQIEAREALGMIGDINKHEESSEEYVFPTRPTHLKIVAQVWQNAHWIIIPFDLRTGLSLAAGQ